MAKEAPKRLHLQLPVPIFMDSFSKPLWEPQRFYHGIKDLGFIRHDENTY